MTDQVAVVRRTELWIIFIPSRCWTPWGGEVERLLLQAQPRMDVRGAKR